VKIEAGKKVLSVNDQQARRNRQRLDALRLLAVNILASPGAGKTSLIIRLLQSLPANLSKAVIEGDVASSIDTDKIIALGYQATQINTDGGCHLDAAMIGRALDELDLQGPGLVFIENIGNLICPAGFELGETLRIVVASVPEGDDKPIKYPGIFATAHAFVLNKVDLLGAVDFDLARFKAGLRAVNDKAPLFEVSCRQGKEQGIAPLRDWALQQARATMA
jgi:hydrogenase nickel incorporation protein HypB